MKRIENIKIHNKSEEDYKQLNQIDKKLERRRYAPNCDLEYQKWNLKRRWRFTPYVVW